MQARRVQLTFIWCGPLAVLLFLIGWVVLAGYLPPIAPTASAHEVADWYVTHVTAIRLGLFVSSIAMPLVIPFGIAIAVQLRASEPAVPILTYGQVAFASLGAVVTVFTMMVWAVAAFRPSETSPDITRMLNDFGWFLFLFTWAPFSLWYVVIGAAILLDENDVPALPRWVAYLNFWVAFLSIPAGLILFFKHGIFAFDGLLALWVPLVVFLIWIITMTVVTTSAINRKSREVQN
ncbi:MAG: hypothetical protein QOD02_3423 [Mycobacterium sp.]|nr:hypothetical protein [Mycobacterium sp.]MDT5170092.1 hypothetical protein [Mycobacterium sp.]